MCGSDKPGRQRESMMATLVCLAIKLEMNFLSAIRMEVAFVHQEAQVERRQYKPHE